MFAPELLNEIDKLTHADKLRLAHLLLARVADEEGISLTQQLLGDEDLQQAAKVNDKGNFEVPFREALDDGLVERHEKHGAFTNVLYANEELGAMFRALMLDVVYERLRQEASRAGA